MGTFQAFLKGGQASSPNNMSQSRVELRALSEEEKARYAADAKQRKNARSKCEAKPMTKKQIERGLSLQDARARLEAERILREERDAEDLGGTPSFYQSLTFADGETRPLQATHAVLFQTQTSHLGVGLERGPPKV